MTPDDLRKLADEATTKPDVLVHMLPVRKDQAISPEERATVAYLGAQAQLKRLAPDLARLCAELGEALEYATEDLNRWLPSNAAEQLQKRLLDALAKLSSLEPQ